LAPAEVTALSSNQKTYILDTSVLLHRAESLFSFGDNQVVLPIVVLDEIDKFKRGTTELNRAARMVIKSLDQIRERGDLDKGVLLENGGTLVININDRDATKLLPSGFEPSNDNRILATALAVQKHREGPVILVSKDINMRVKAQALGLMAEDYRYDQIVDIDEMFTGHRDMVVPEDVIADLYRDRSLPLDRVGELSHPLAPNEFVMLTGGGPSSPTALTRFNQEAGLLNRLREVRFDIWGIRPLNREQQYAFEVLLDDEVQLVTLAGKAGTGKTILAIAVGLQKVVNEKVYRRLAIYRPVIPMGRDIGFLPGTEQEKLSPWMQPIMDNLEFLLNEHGGGKKGSTGRAEYLLDSNLLDIRALTYIRGRSLPQQFIIIDEAQNLTPHEVKTIVTRAGEGTKVVFTGDPYQIDNPYLDSTSNGLTHLVERFRDHAIAAHVTLSKGERSKLAELASVVMEA
jgi:PhoH-like ATPase